MLRIEDPSTGEPLDDVALSDEAAAADRGSRSGERRLGGRFRLAQVATAVIRSGCERAATPLTHDTLRYGLRDVVDAALLSMLHSVGCRVVMHVPAGQEHGHEGCSMDGSAPGAG
jgi:hypothetical protein